MPAKKKKTTAKKTVKRAVKKAAKKLPNPHHPSAGDSKVTAKAIGLVDKAAALLRQGIRTTSKETAAARLTSKKKAHSLLSEATQHLHGLISKL